MADRFRCLIMGAAGRDFHDFQTFFRERPEFQVLGFTAAQIPFIERRYFPRELAGPGYDQDIPIYSESQLGELIERLRIDWVFLAYSDLSHADVMHKASLAAASGASFALLGPRHTQLDCRLPVVAVTAVRTGAGKSPLSQWLAAELQARGRKVGVLRHPMPYGDLRRQAVERFSTPADLDRFECTIEEREEYEPYVERGLTIFAGVDYARIVEAASREADLLLWDGGNNDFSFLRPTVPICVVDALRPGHETAYYPGEVNLRQAAIVVINKVSGAAPGAVASIRRNIIEHNSGAAILESDLEVRVDRPELLTGRRALVIEDGPTITHGGMTYGAGMIAARRYGVGGLVDPRPTAVGSVAEALKAHPQLDRVLPALGYSAEQREDLAATIERSGAEVVIDASPCRLDRLLDLQRPVVRVRYEFRQTAGPPIVDLLFDLLRAAKAPNG